MVPASVQRSGYRWRSELSNVTKCLIRPPTETPSMNSQRLRSEYMPENRSATSQISSLDKGRAPFISSPSCGKISVHRSRPMLDRSMRVKPKPAQAAFPSKSNSTKKSFAFRLKNVQIWLNSSKFSFCLPRSFR